MKFITTLLMGVGNGGRGLAGSIIELNIDRKVGNYI